ncbi:Uncharacterised protein [Legionella hackeliae]|nr:Uncharacterised protein [Legionella hackeliae]
MPRDGNFLSDKFQRPQLHHRIYLLSLASLKAKSVQK